MRKKTVSEFEKKYFDDLRDQIIAPKDVGITVTINDAKVVKALLVESYVKEDSAAITRKIILVRCHQSLSPY